MGGIGLVNIRTFDLNLLRALHALLENGNVSAAARQLNLSQPATSAALSRLRHALGDVLLVRDGNRMSLSPRAERLLPRVQLLMSEIELALRTSRSLEFVRQVNNVQASHQTGRTDGSLRAFQSAPAQIPFYARSGNTLRRRRRSYSQWNPPGL